MNSAVLYHSVLGQYFVLAEDSRGRSFKLLEHEKSYFTPQDVNKVAHQWSKLPILSHMPIDDIVRHIKEISNASIPATAEEYQTMKEDIAVAKESCADASASIAELAKEVDLLKIVVRQREEIERLKAEVRQLEGRNRQMAVTDEQMDDGASDKTVFGKKLEREAGFDESFATAVTSLER